jgi:hypothetical protein
MDDRASELENMNDCRSYYEFEKCRWPTQKEKKSERKQGAEEKMKT